MSPITAPSDPAYDLAVRHLQEIFKGDPNPDRRLINDIYVANGWDLTKTEQNKHRLRDYMTDIRRFGLADSIRSSIDDRTVEGVFLFEKGKQVLSAAIVTLELDEHDSAAQPLLDRIAHDVREAIDQYPNLEIELHINVRREGVESAPR